MKTKSKHNINSGKERKIQMKTKEAIQEELKTILSEKRYLHSVGVMKKAEELAKIYGIDANISALTGLTHDIAKEISNMEKIKYVKDNHIEVDNIEMHNIRTITCKNWSRYRKGEIWFYRRNAKSN